MLAAMKRRVPILLADRDTAVLQSLAFWLKAEGHDVRAFTSGEDILKEALPDEAIFVIDHDLGDLTAFEVIERCRDRGRTYPVLLLSSSLDPEMTEAAQRYGFAVIEKPMLTDDVLTAINRLV
ncbi:MAG: response regulator receiver protein [Frankiales bacterium]|nr:response regulator receiver protein [Frankiales bacterium]